MNVAAILASKGREVLTTTETDTISDAVAVLARRKIGALVVLGPGERIVGIISERDVVRAVGTIGADVLGQPIGTIMTRAVMTCGEDETLDEVMTRMTRGRFRHLPVARNERLVGIVSIGDVVKARIEQVEREAEEMRAYIATA